MRSTSLLLLATLVFLTGCTKELRVENVSFGAFDGVGSGSITFKETKLFSKAEESEYGWTFSIQEPPPSLTLKEVVSGPHGVVWDALRNTPGIEWSDDGRTVAITKVIQKPSSRLSFHNWATTASDPIGTYHAKLYIEGKLVAETDFVVSQ